MAQTKSEFELPTLRRSFSRWYAVDKKKREPATQKMWAALYGVHPVTVARWAAAIRNGEKDFEQAATFEAMSDEQLRAISNGEDDEEFDGDAANEAVRELEWRKCAHDEVYFIREYCLMWTQQEDEDDVGDPIPFDLWDVQEEAIADFNIHGQNDIVLKTRRLGLSWTVLAWCLHRTMFRKNYHAYFRSIGLKEAAEQHTRFKFMYDNLPDWMQERVKLGGGKGLKRNDSISEFSNGSAIHMLSSSKKSGHGSSPSVIVWDEMARDDNALEGWRAIKPAAARTKIIIISTSDGPGNQYHKVWQGAAKDAKEGEKRNTFKRIFYPASRHPHYTPEFLKAEREEYEANGDLPGFHQAYPETPELAFQASSKCPFPGDKLSAMLAHAQQPVLRGSIEDGEFAPSERGHLYVWEPPVTDKRDENGKLIRRAHSYTMGVDVAGGLARGDFSAFVVFDSTENRVVALFRARIAPEMYAYPIEQAALWYNEAFVGVEMNKFDAVLQDLKQTYSNLFMRERREKPWDAPTMEVGWYTEAKAKKDMVFEIRRGLSGLADFADKPLDIPSERILSELMIYEEDERGSYNAPKGEHDDCVVALGIALCIRHADSLPQSTGNDFESDARAFDYAC